jgi:hypothetical protein
MLQMDAARCSGVASSGAPGGDIPLPPSEQAGRPLAGLRSRHSLAVDHRDCLARAFGCRADRLHRGLVRTAHHSCLDFAEVSPQYPVFEVEIMDPGLQYRQLVIARRQRRVIAVVIGFAPSRHAGLHPRPLVAVAEHIDASILWQIACHNGGRRGQKFKRMPKQLCDPALTYGDRGPIIATRIHRIRQD